MPLKTSRDEQTSMNLTPMVDVMFNLIIFFMAGTSFTVMERNIGLNVPEVAEQNLPMTEPPAKRIVNVYRDGKVTLDRQTVSLEELTQRLARARSQYQGLGVIVRGDADARLQVVADVLAACKKSGIRELAVAYRVGKEQR